MARIPPEQIERPKEEVSVQRLAEAMSVQLKRHGTDLIGLCSFHDDHALSLVISPQKKLRAVVLPAPSSEHPGLQLALWPAGECRGAAAPTAPIRGSRWR